jgi:Flp pilus assembly protein TadB
LVDLAKEKGRQVTTGFLIGLAVVGLITAFFGWASYRSAIINRERDKTERAKHEVEIIAKQRDIAAGPRESLGSILDRMSRGDF